MVEGDTHINYSLLKLCKTETFYYLKIIYKYSDNQEFGIVGITSGRG
jgi:hypothetical protein